ncbi:PEGA domain-containing protein [uncultured Methanospirillum sp.]|uniref:PEGA domain-containing protein n=1 Tax=uncultured Methanospirillum sp. TaxID=262503 RepID=UPI0029C9337B|nr:PEGA domain-containing protein [uncultured Methanospirillum sp.]
MEFNKEQMRKLQVERVQMSRVPTYQGVSLPPASKSLLSAMPYVGKERDQGYCGNCWVWASIGLLEIAHTVNDEVSDRLSVQYFNSNWNNGSIQGNACRGGWTGDVASFFNNTLHQAVPWSNSNASYADYYWTSGKTSAMPASYIATSPNYPFISVTDNIIWAYDGQTAAINTIKSLINSDIPVIYTFYLPQDGWTSFRSFWKNESENILWDPDIYNETIPSAGHCTIIVGYNDTCSDPYWIVLNSWGIKDQRPTGLFRLKMYMNYNSTYHDGEDYGYMNYFETFTTEYKPLPRGTGNLTISSSPSSVSIWIDDQNTGILTPQTIMNITSGDHTLKLTKNGYVDYNQSFSIKSNITTMISATLTRAGKLSVITKPAGSSVWLDGSDTGKKTSCTLSPLTPEIHDVKLAKSGFENYSTSVQIQPGFTSQIIAILNQTGGTVSISSVPSGAVIFVDQVDTGFQTPQSISGLTPGIHTILLKKDLYKDWTDTVSIKARETTQVSATMMSGGYNGSIFIYSTPSGAEISLDGKNTQYQTAKKISGIPAGSHTLGLHTEGYANWSETITVKKGVTTTVSAKLYQ